MFIDFINGYEHILTEANIYICYIPLPTKQLQIVLDLEMELS